MGKPLFLLLLLALLVLGAPLATHRNAAANPLTGLVSVSAGGQYTCALTTAGGVKCWGQNGAGQLGTGMCNPCVTPVDVTGLSSGVTATSAGGAHTCALTMAGGVKCWGDNSFGQLGNGTTSSSSTPVDVTGLTSGAGSVSAGSGHSCALTVAGGVKCWGSNNHGQLGNGTITDSSTPVDVSGLTTGVAAVSAGGDSTCAVTTAGGLKCWGANDDGQLGDGTNSGPQTCNTFVCSTTPVDVTGLTSGVAAVSVAGGHACALTTAGGLKCWGENVQGQVGNGGACYLCTTAQDVAGLGSGVGAIAAGWHHTCAITTAGGLKCWGLNSSGQLGDGTFTDSNTPTDVSGLTSGAGSVSSGYDHTCALTAAGSLKCWGDNTFGQLGNGTTTNSNTPVSVVQIIKSVGGITSLTGASAPQRGMPGAFEALAAAVAAVGGLAAWRLKRGRATRAGPSRSG